MLKGNLNCKELNRLLISYIQFELPKKEMEKVALHLRNCPVCMEKYSALQKRRKELRVKMTEIEKTLRMEMEISSYIDNEASEDVIFIIEGMVQTDNRYKNELIENEKIRQILLRCKKEIKNTTRPKNTYKILAKMKQREKRRQKLLKSFTQLFQPLHHVFAKSE